MIFLFHIFYENSNSVTQSVECMEACKNTNPEAENLDKTKYNQVKQSRKYYSKWVDQNVISLFWPFFNF